MRFGRTGWAVAFLALCLAPGAVPAPAAVQVGQTSEDSLSCVTGATTRVQASTSGPPGYQVPSEGGVVVS